MLAGAADLPPHPPPCPRPGVPGRFGAKVKKTLGPITAFAYPNSRPYSRLGLSIGRRFGQAHDRVHLKRLLRDAFRLCQNALPLGETGGYDFVLTPRAHEPLHLTDYQRILLDLAAQLDREWQRRRRRTEGA